MITLQPCNTTKILLRFISKEPYTLGDRIASDNSKKILLFTNNLKIQQRKIYKNSWKIKSKKLMSL